MSSLRSTVEEREVQGILPLRGCFAFQGVLVRVSWSLIFWVALEDAYCRRLIVGVPLRAANLGL